MIEKQRTIENVVSLSGIGIHSGETTTITFKPAPENYGYRFIRTDLPEEIEIPALVEYVVDLSRGTTIGIDDVKVLTVEHVLAALSGLQIDNCRIELDGVEPPVIDGSSIAYVDILQSAGIVEQSANREYFELEETIRYSNEDNHIEIVALPTDDFRITVMVDYFNPALGSQHTGLFNLEKEFVSEFAPARTFCFLTEVESLVEQGLIKGGNSSNALVIVDKDVDEKELSYLQKLLKIEKPITVGTNGFLNNTELRYKNEPARHKLLDMLGDLALAGVKIKAQILAARPGHAANIEFARKIRTLYKKTQPKQKFKRIDGNAMYMDIYQLMKVMPHRYPFLLIDRILDYNENTKTIIGIKNVTVNEPYFTGHFPNKPVMPGVLICEAMAQTGCLMLLSKENVETKLALFMGINNAKFRKPVIPGDQLVMELQLTGKKFNAYTFKGSAYVNGQLVAEAVLQAALVDKDIQNNN